MRGRRQAKPGFVVLASICVKTKQDGEYADVLARY
jgi:hypothetical protein